MHQNLRNFEDFDNNTKINGNIFKTKVIPVADICHENTQGNETWSEDRNQKAEKQKPEGRILLTKRLNYEAKITIKPPKNIILYANP